MPSLPEPMLEALGQAHRALYAFDFDGTLAPITADRDAAGPRARTLALLTSLAQRVPCAVLSGRARADVAARLPGVPLVAIIGNHGLEPGRGLAAFARQIRRVRARLGRRLAPVVGVDIEAKRYSLAVHFRAARDRRAAHAAILRAITELESPLRVVPGKLVVNVVPAAAPHKGTALRALRRRLRADRVLYVGDDVTDEDVFTLPRAPWLLGVHVGGGASAARFRLPSQRAIDALLAQLRRDVAP